MICCQQKEVIAYFEDYYRNKILPRLGDYFHSSAHRPVKLVWKELLKVKKHVVNLNILNQVDSMFDLWKTHNIHFISNVSWLRYNPFNIIVTITQFMYGSWWKFPFNICWHCVENSIALMAISWKIPLH